MCSGVWFGGKTGETTNRGGGGVSCKKQSWSVHRFPEIHVKDEKKMQQAACEKHLPRIKKKKRKDNKEGIKRRDVNDRN